MQKIWDRIRFFKRFNYLWWVILLFGIFLRVYLYLLNRSLWQDEASLAMNLVHRSFGELTQTLDYHQAAPIGFLFIEKFFVSIFGPYDYVMRIFPVVSGILAIYFIFRFAQRHIGSAGLFALTISSVAWSLVYYATELKQYSSDVMVLSLMIFLAGNALKKKTEAKDFFLLGIIGSLVIWISHPSVFVLAGIGLTLLFEKFTRKEYVPWIWILGVGTSWLLSFGLEYFVSLRHIVADGYMIEYWRKAYVPSPPWTNKAWYIKTFLYFLDFSFNNASPMMAWFTIGLTSLGVLSVSIRNRKIALILISPFIFVFIASILERYPIKNRFVLFLIPLVFLLMAEGFYGVYWLFSKLNRKFSVILTTSLAFFLVWTIFSPTYTKVFFEKPVDIRPVLKYVADSRKTNDLVYVFHRTRTVFEYYAPFYGLDTGNVVIGVSAENKERSLESYIDDVTGFVGKERVWFIFTEVATGCPNCEGEDTQAFYLDYVNESGELLETFSIAGVHSANAYLYDMMP